MVEITEIEEEKLTEIAIVAAQKAAKKFGLKIGKSLVASPDDEFAYVLKDVVGEKALLERPKDPKDQDGPKITKTVNLETLFDIHDAIEGGTIAGGLLKSRKIAKEN